MMHSRESVSCSYFFPGSFPVQGGLLRPRIRTRSGIVACNRAVFFLDSVSSRLKTGLHDHLHIRLYHNVQYEQFGLVVLS